MQRDCFVLPKHLERVFTRQSQRSALHVCRMRKARHIDEEETWYYVLRGTELLGFWVGVCHDSKNRSSIMFNSVEHHFCGSGLVCWCVAR